MAAAATGLLVIDTDVLIDYLRDQPQAVAFLEGSDRPLAASVVSIAELYVGVREGAERQRLDVFASAFEVLALGQEAAVQAGLFRRQYGRSHGTGPGRCPDCRDCADRRSNIGHPQSASFPDAGQCAGALYKRELSLHRLPASSARSTDPLGLQFFCWRYSFLVA
jgi:predicted nucleic acid-binding protein